MIANGMKQVDNCIPHVDAVLETPCAEWPWLGAAGGASKQRTEDRSELAQSHSQSQLPDTRLFVVLT